MSTVNISTSISQHILPRVTVSVPTPTGQLPTKDTDETLPNLYLTLNTPRLSIPTAHPLHLVHNHAHFTHRVNMPNIAYNLYFVILVSLDSYQMVTLSTRSQMIWAMWILHCIVSSETQFETWWWPSARAETSCFSNKYSTTLLVVFCHHYVHHLIVSNTTGMSQLKKLH